ncbi:hypothetical protein LOC67_02930 [Stieleria sp. JC731]|uniref:hypothetical protein n=1 Tax=Pirellulaceae TaxID=2691357 RepID=UPI001E4556D8|nr:hypothetical protein [Stieleria sp. JC731]MCC9599500.1 hypothetical protein [Stieleria sp. JC731]
MRRDLPLCFLFNLLCLGLGAGLFAPADAAAEIVFNSLGESYFDNFESYTASGMQPGGGGGTLDSNVWEISFFDSMGSQSSGIGSSHGSGLFGRGLSSVAGTEQGVYAYQTGNGNTALGIALDSTELAGAFPALEITNNTGSVIDWIDVSYDVWVFNQTDVQSFVDLEFSKDSLFVDPLFFETPATADGLVSWTMTPISYSLLLPITSTTDFSTPLTPLANGESIELGFSIGKFGGIGDSDGVAIDNLRITVGTTAIPEPNAINCLIALSSLLSLRRSRRPHAK